MHEKYIWILVCLLGVTCVVSGSIIVGRDDSRYQLSLLAGMDRADLDQQSVPYSSVTVRECVDEIVELSQNSSPAKRKVDELITALTQHQPSNTDPDIIHACHHLRDELHNQIVLHEKLAFYGSISYMMEQAKKIDFHYRSIGETFAYIDVVQSLEQMRPTITNMNNLYQKNVDYWRETYRLLELTMHPVLKKYHEDFALVLGNSSGFMSEMDMYFAMNSAPPPSPHPDQSQLIVVDLSDQMVYAYEGKYLVGSSSITTGRKQYPTHPGMYKILEKKQGKWMVSPFPQSRYRLWVDYWIRFSNSGYGFHDTCNSKNCWRTEFGEANYTQYGSHGCVNTPYDFVQWMFDWGDLGTRVIVQK